MPSDFVIRVAKKTRDPEFFGKDSPWGYTVNGQQGAAIVLREGESYTFDVDTPHHPFYFTRSKIGTRADTTLPIRIEGFVQDAIKAVFTIAIPIGATNLPARFYYQCHEHPNMGGTVIIKAAVDTGACQSCQQLASSVCDRCGIARYCNKTCQSADWLKHKLACHVQTDSGVGYDFGNLETDTLQNTDYRRVVFTSQQQQRVLMSILPSEGIPAEIHWHTTQFIRVESGTGYALLNQQHKVELSTKSTDFVHIGAGVEHEIVVTGAKPLKLYSIYSPPNHPKDLVQERAPPH